MLSTLDKSGVAVRQTCGRDPHHGIQIFDAPVGGPSLPAWLLAPPLELLVTPPRPPTPWTRARGLQAAPPP
jgi:hypothetical protein